MFKGLKKIDGRFDLKMFSDYADQEGMCILHSGKEGLKDEKWTIVGLKPVRQADFQIGYLAYPNIKLKNNIPNQKFYKFDSLLLHNNQTDELFSLGSDDWKTILKNKSSKPTFKTSGKLQQSVTKEQYIQKIEEVKELLAAGEIYQMCYCIRFRKRFSGNPYALFLRLTKSNPVDFAAYLNCGDFQIISSSPERFFKVHDGKITTTPIKGTISKKEEGSLQYLLASEKEQAELDMITDLERNDVGKICEFGTLKLKKEREILELKNLWHTYSEVEGKLCSDIGPNEVIKAMFPGGSITGCPKKRAMEYISLLEGLPRNIFTGSIGYVANSSISDLRSQIFESNLKSRNLKSQIKSEIRNQKSEIFSMDFNIAIRTVLIKDGYLEFWAGGGIVADSDPEKEYEECYLKAERFLGIIKP